MKYKVGDKIITIKDCSIQGIKKGTKGIITEVTALWYYTDILCYNGKPSLFEEKEIKLHSSENVYQKQVDNLEASMDSYKDKSTCKHEWIVVGMGLYGDYINCKHCDMKKEDYVEEDESDVDDLIRSYFDIPF